MPAKPEDTRTSLAAARAGTLADLALLQASLKRIDEFLIQLGPGRYSDESGEHVFQVIAATADKPGEVTYALPSDAEEAARKLSGEQFPQLFDRLVTYAPCEGFALLAPKLLTPAKARDVVQLCQVPGKLTKGKAAYVKAA